MEELRKVATAAARSSLLPPTFAPYSVWNDEAGEELFASWLEERLLGRGQLLALLDRAYSKAAFRSLAARSLRQHLINSQDRSQAQNLYRRLTAILGDESAFRVVKDATRPSYRWFFPLKGPEDPAVWTGDDRALASHAWALGDFIVIRYRAASRKLAPVLDEAELRRFASELMQLTGCAMSAAVVNRALAGRFGLEGAATVALEEGETELQGPDRTEDEILLRDTARWILGQLSERQREILRLSESEGIAEIAEALGCSNATVFNEQRRIGTLVDRFSADREERDRVLKIAVDLLYRDSDE